MRVLFFVIVLPLVALLAALAGNTLRQESRQLEVTPAAEVAAEIAIDDSAAAVRLAQAIRHRTISDQDPARFDGGPFLALHGYLAGAFPRLHETLAREVVNDYSLLYTWAGSDAELRGILLLGHLDVVPVEPGTEGEWSHPPFSGAIAGGRIWGRGALDDKVQVMAILEAVEALVAEGYQPKRTITLAFGHDEELGGVNGAAAIAAKLAERDARFYYSLDEGSVIIQGVMPGVARPIALIGLAEKGYVSLELTARSPGGHSAMPPRHSSAGLLANAIHALEANRMAAAIIGPVAEMFAYLGPEAAYPLRLLYTNRWLFGPLIAWQLSGQPATNALVRTTTATTMLRAGVKENVLPAEARAVVNFRILPGDSIAGVVAHARAEIDNPRVAVKALPGNEPSPVSDSASASFKALHKTVVQVFADAVVAPGLVIAATDTKHYVDMSDDSYRFLPLRLGAEDLKRIHGSDERITLDNYAEIIRFYLQLIRNTAS